MKIIVLGSGADRIGKTAALDRFTFQVLRFLKEQRHEPVMKPGNMIVRE